MFFEIAMTREELRTEYRRLCVKMHPDKGGNHEEFCKMTAEYEKVLKNINCPEWDRNPENDWEAFKSFEAVTVTLKGYSFKMDLVGNWLWLEVVFSADNWRMLIEVLKINNWKFSKGKNKWYYFNGVEDFRPSRKSSSDFNTIKSTWGVFGHIENEETKTERIGV